MKTASLISVTIALVAAALIATTLSKKETPALAETVNASIQNKIAGISTSQTEALTEERSPLAKPSSPLPYNELIEIQEQAATSERNRIMRHLGENMLNKGMNKMIYDQQRVLMTDKYRDLANSLNLSDDEADYFLDLITSRQMLFVNFGMKLMTGTISPAEQALAMDQLQLDALPINEAIDYFLNNSDDSEYLHYYESTEQQRTAVNSFSESAGLTPDIGEELVGIIYEEVNRQALSLQFNEDGQPDPGQLNDESIAQYGSELSTLSPQILERAADVLDPEQLIAFEAAYASYVNNETMRLQMIKQLMS